MSKRGFGWKDVVIIVLVFIVVIQLLVAFRVFNFPKLSPDNPCIFSQATPLTSGSDNPVYTQHDYSDWKLKDLDSYIGERLNAAASAYNRFVELQNQLIAWMVAKNPGADTIDASYPYNVPENVQLSYAVRQAYDHVEWQYGYLMNLQSCRDYLYDIEMALPAGAEDIEFIEPDNEQSSQINQDSNLAFESGAESISEPN